MGRQPLRRRLKLPRRYYKRTPLPPAVRVGNERFTARLAADLGSIGPDRNRGISTIRKILLQDVATAILNDTRAAHINITMGNEPGVSGPSVPGWKQLKQQGSLNEEVAILVDGSPNRPIKNVRFAGDITIVAPPSTEQIIEAAEFAWTFLIGFAANSKGPDSGNVSKKGRAGAGYRYFQSFEMFVNGERKVMAPADLRRPGVFEDGDFIVIHNYVPYAAKLERYRYPQSYFYQAFKRTRAKFGRQIAVRFDFVASTATTVTSSSGGQVPNAQPVLMLGDPRAFPSRAAPMKKIIKDANRRNGRS